METEELIKQVLNDLRENQKIALSENAIKKIDETLKEELKGYAVSYMSDNDLKPFIEAISLGIKENITLGSEVRNALNSKDSHTVAKQDVSAVVGKALKTLPVIIPRVQLRSQNKSDASQTYNNTNTIEQSFKENLDKIITKINDTNFGLSKNAKEKIIQNIRSTLNINTLHPMVAKAGEEELVNFVQKISVGLKKKITFGSRVKHFFSKIFLNKDQLAIPNNDVYNIINDAKSELKIPLMHQISEAMTQHTKEIIQNKRSFPKLSKNEQAVFNAQQKAGGRGFTRSGGL